MSYGKGGDSGTDAGAYIDYRNHFVIFSLEGDDYGPYNFGMSVKSRSAQKQDQVSVPKDGLKCDHYIALCHAIFGGDDVLSESDLKDKNRSLVRAFRDGEDFVEKFSFCPLCGEALS